MKLCSLLPVLGALCASVYAEDCAALADNKALHEAFVARAQAVYKRLPAMDRLYLHEGPGFTRETAWVVDGAELSQAPAAVVRLLFFIYDDEKQYPIVAFHEDRLELDGKTYLYTANVILYQGKKYRVEQWVDISAYNR